MTWFYINFCYKTRIRADSPARSHFRGDTVNTQVPSAETPFLQPQRQQKVNKF